MQADRKRAQLRLKVVGRIRSVLERQTRCIVDERERVKEGGYSFGAPILCPLPTTPVLSRNCETSGREQFTHVRAHGEHKTVPGVIEQCLYTQLNRLRRSLFGKNWLRPLHIMIKSDI